MNHKCNYFNILLYQLYVITISPTIRTAHPRYHTLHTLHSTYSTYTTLYPTDDVKPIACDRTLGAVCLFNITSDPCEHRNLAAEFPSLVAHLELLLEQFAIRVSDCFVVSIKTSASISKTQFGGVQYFCI